MQNEPDLDQVKAEMLAGMNEMRTHLGMGPLKTFPERVCAFCGKSEEEVGASFHADVLEFICICRACSGKAQRFFSSELAGE
jgi:hypothetical protein